MTDKNSKIVGLISLTFLLLIGVLIVTLHEITLQQKSEELNTYQNQNKTQIGLGEMLMLDSYEDLKGLKNHWTAGFDWRGTLEVKPLEVTAIPLDENRLQIEQLVSKRDIENILKLNESAFLVLLKLQITNISANPIATDEKPSFQVDLFTLNASGTEDEIVYVDYGEFSAAVDKEKDFYKYYVPIGKTGDITIGYLVTDSTLKKGIDIRVGRIDKYTIHIPYEDIKK